MFNQRKKERKYDVTIKRIMDELDVEMPGEDRYQKLIKNLQDIERLQKEIDEPFIDPNKALMVFANIAGLVAILSYEQTHVISSKALQFIMKMK